MGDLRYLVRFFHVVPPSSERYNSLPIMPVPPRPAPPPDGVAGLPLSTSAYTMRGFARYTSSPMRPRLPVGKPPASFCHVAPASVER